ncbi:rhodanese-like domain-containing protein [Desulfonatronum thioautotrophicum]|uniref:rhodanese-like domain-containing protein n=1 Tax=Desulfonatronum thioautotrophicum TaxID=617001 RepID=UPI0006996922|nr:rhodanese-like domain-containing protein [Desulfonatronum thioautotrophicum]
MPVQPIFPEEIPTFSSRLTEAEYALVDVRQPGEYQEGHIPGARLLPLPEIEDHLDELRSTPNLIFYCRSGARSQAAASMAQEALPPQTRILNMTGGFLAWEGNALTDMPRMALFDHDQTLKPSQALLRAMELEKAAQRFYQSAATRAHSPELTKTLETLAKVEQAHAHVLYHRLQQIDPASAPRDFTDYFAGMQGDILEGGLSMEDAVAALGQAQEQAQGKGQAPDKPRNQNNGISTNQQGKAREQFCLGITELALQIELMAYDLYKNLALSHSGTELESVFLDLAQDERGHQRLLARILPKCVD